MGTKQKLEMHSRVDEASGCHVWTAYRNADGYGVVLVGSRKDGSRRNALAHRAAWANVNGPIPAGLVICHRCDNPACINTDHLFLGSVSTNNSDMRAKGRHARGSKHGLSKLSEDRVREIFAAPGRHSEIAECYGVHRMHVGAIKRGEKWAHLTGGAR